MRFDEGTLSSFQFHIGRATSNGGSIVMTAFLTVGGTVAASRVDCSKKDCG